MKIICFIVFQLLFLFSICATENNNLKTLKVTVNNQDFEIILPTNLFYDFIKNQNKFSSTNNALENLVFTPLANVMLKNADAPFMFSSIKRNYYPDNELKEQLHLLESINIISLIKPTLEKITDILPGPYTKIVILPVSPEMSPYLKKYNIQGYGATLGKGKIIIAIDPRINGWKEFLNYTISHEYHHSTWIYRNWVSPNFSLLEYIVFEGRADIFAHSINPKWKIPAQDYLNKDQEKATWNLIKSKLSNRDSKLINEVLNGGNNIPFGSCYTLGYNIVSSFKAKNMIYTEIEIIDIDPIIILELSRYGESSN